MFALKAPSSPGQTWVDIPLGPAVPHKSSCFHCAVTRHLGLCSHQLCPVKGHAWWRRQGTPVPWFSISSAGVLFPEQLQFIAQAMPCARAFALILYMRLGPQSLHLSCCHSPKTHGGRSLGSLFAGNKSPGGEAGM